MQFEPGNGSDLVVSFSGIYANSRSNPTEFWTTLHALGKPNMLFIADLSDLWFNLPGMMARVEQVLHSVVEKLKPKRIFMLGNSMGGYGACIFAKTIDATAVLAFCPQVSLDPKVVSDRRWQKFYRRIDNFPAPVLGDELSDSTRYFVLHGLRGLESEQAKAMPSSPNFRHYVFPKMFHSVAEQIRKQKKLITLVGHFLKQDTPSMDLLLAEFGGRPKHPDTQL